MATSAWNVDKSHTTIEFQVKHMMFTNVRGAFDDFEATVQADPADLTTAQIEFRVKTASVNTRNGDRDGHLRSADFFDVENHPEMVFKSTKITKTGDDTYDVTGDLTIRETTKPVTFKTEVTGQGKDPWGNEVAGIAATGKVNRKDFGLVWNAALETGGVLVGDDVKITIDIEAQKQA